MSKTVNTRIKLKYDTLANWTSNNPKLLAGEIALVSVPAEQTADNDTTPVMYKVGDGTNNFTDLQWGSAKAADVYSWAKQSKPVVSLSGSSGNVVTGISSNSDGITYTMSTIATTDTKNTAGATTDITNNLYFIGTQVSGSSYTQSYCNPKIVANGNTLSVSPDTGGTIKAYKGSYYNTVDIGYGTDVNNYITISNNTISAPSQVFLSSGSNQIEVASNGITVQGDIQSSSTIKSTKFITDGGTSSKFVKGDGSLDSNTYALASAIQTVNNGTLTIQANGTQKGTFSANQSSNTTVNITAADLGLSSAMKFGGVALQSLSEGGTQNAGATSGNYTTSTQPSNGTVYLDKAGHLEYVWVSGTSSALGHWELLGQDGSYALSSVTVTGTGALGGGGDLTKNETITHNAGNAASKPSGFYKFSTDAYSHVDSVTSVTSSDLSSAGAVTSMYYRANNNGSQQRGIRPSAGQVFMDISSATLSLGVSLDTDNFVKYQIDLKDSVLTTDDQVIIDCGSSSVNVF